MTGDYSIPDDWGGEAERLRLLAEWRDPVTLPRMEALGLREGWRCLEVGVGCGATARAMGSRVGPAGNVVAVDINAGFLEALAGAPGVETRVCDVRVEDFPAGSFDLIHTRFVLAHLPDRVGVMKRMVDWVAPGGWVFFEEPDPAAALVSPNPLWAHHWQAYVADTGYDVRCGRVLPAEVRALGLAGVGCHIDTDVVEGGTDLARVYSMTMEALAPAHLRTGAITEAEIDLLRAQLEEPDFLEPGFTVVGVWGSKPR